MMRRPEEFVDERHKGFCIHCGGTLVQSETSKDHIPSKALLREPYPANLPTVKICRDCNSGFSADEEYMAAFLSAVLTGSTDLGQQVSPAANRILAGNRRLRSQIERTKMEDRTLWGGTRTIWEPDMSKISRVIVKNARGHAFFEYGEPLLSEPEHIVVRPLETLTSKERVDFETIDMGAGWPEVGSRMTTRVITGQDLEDGWVVVQDGVYRYAVMQQSVMVVRIVIAEYLAAEVWWED